MVRHSSNSRNLIQRDVSARKCSLKRIITILQWLGILTTIASIGLTVLVHWRASKSIETYSNSILLQVRDQYLGGDSWILGSSDNSRQLDKETLVAPLTNASSAACMLIMDDNHWLVEWLAYHYTTMNLRYLIIAIDERSKTSPIEILDRYKGRVDFSLWNDSHFFEDIPVGENLQTINLLRQQTFLAKCMQTLKLRPEAGWTFFTDTDEFIVVNRRTQDQESPLYRDNVPSLHQPGFIVAFLEHEKQEHKTICFSMGRLQFAPDESDPQQVQSNVSQVFNASHFMTLRWLNAAADLVGPKNIVDLAAIAATDIPPDVTYQHQVLWQYCGATGFTWSHTNSSLQVYHYSGTYEQFHFRDDARWSSQGNNFGRNGRFKRYVGTFLERADDLRPWISSFLLLVGEQEAVRLLDGVGRTSNWPPASAHANRFADPQSVPSEWPPEEALNFEPDIGAGLVAGSTFYSKARPDRSGAAIADMLLAHAYAFAHNLTYGGACGRDHNYYKKETLQLIKTIGMRDILRFRCPDKGDEAPVVGRHVYSAEKSRLWNKKYLSLLHGKIKYPKAKYSVVIHVRRGDVTPCGDYAHRYLPNSHYLDIVQQYIRNDTSVAVYSESEAFEPFDDFRNRNYSVHLDTDLAEVWKSIMTADFVILSKSSFSFVPAMLNPKATVIYTSFLNPSLPSWKTVRSNIVDRSSELLMQFKAGCVK